MNIVYYIMYVKDIVWVSTVMTVIRNTTDM